MRKRSALWKHHAVVSFVAIVAGLLPSCGNSEPKSASPQADLKSPDLKSIAQPGPGKEDAKSPKARPAKRPAPTPPKPAPEPPWLLTLPSGSKLNAFLRPEGEQRFFLGRAGRFSGLYELRGSRLVMEKPQDRLETGFEWEARGADEFTLVAQRPDLDNNYLGATLKKVQGEANKPSAP